jgi:P27 family predicted phage terminase small subunit
MRGSDVAAKRGEEPLSDGVIVAPDIFLDSDARKKWDETVASMTRMGTLDSSDAAAIARYAVSYSLWKKLTEFIDENGTAYQSVMGAHASYPQVVQCMKLMELMLRLEQALGLTPTARAVLGARSVKKKGNDDDDFFSREATA